MKTRVLFKKLRYIIFIALMVTILPLGSSTAATNPTLHVELVTDNGTCNDSEYEAFFGWLSEVDDQDGFDVVGVIIYDANGSRIAADWNGFATGLPYTYSAIFGGTDGMNPISARPLYIEMYDLTSFPPDGYNTDAIYDNILDQASNGAPLMLSMAYDPAVDISDCANLPDQAPLAVSATCVDEDLEVAITSGNGPFDIESSLVSAPNVPANGALSGTTIIEGPGKWDNLTVTETTGIEVSNLGNLRCRPTERPVPLTPAHRTRTVDPNPGFTWTAVTDATNYRIWLYSEVANTPDFELFQNTGGATTFVPSAPLEPRRYFWRVRGRVNNIWSRWSVRFTLFIDPPPTIQHSELPTTPIPTIELAPPNPRATIGAPLSTLEPPSSPPNSR